MSSISRKSKESLALEIVHCREMAKNHFAIELNVMKLDEQLQGLIIKKIEDYFHQRFKDWTVVDLLAFRSELEPHVSEQRAAYTAAEKKLKRAVKEA